MPGSWLSQYALLNGRSVPSCWVTWYCSGLSFCLSSDSLGFLKVMGCHPLGSVCEVEELSVPSRQSSEGVAADMFLSLLSDVWRLRSGDCPHNSLILSSRPQPIT